ncbi:linear amide C-N hydrolase [Paludisphaera rhizosphaerae]|uniref:linear amide C-N hydrolase n=1 Tax=Paludisphaera rhizosphaerae TaxID=2711216 RepID=UPI001980DE8E|nr:linear amide C-N hydrolase [Paludisphaera rhizosphaerae]
MMKAIFRSLAVAVVILGSASDVALACTRCVYLGPDHGVLVARSFDWMEDTRTNLYALPRGVKRDGAAGSNSFSWTSKYGSVVATMYEIASVDGMNEKGLVANILYLAESDYGKADGSKPTLSISLWTQYVLDQFGTVAEAVEALRKEPFRVVAPILPNGSPATGHLAITDPTGDTAVFEYIGGVLKIHHGREYPVMTNSPTFDRQLAINGYWDAIGGDVMLPGGIRAADRFVRASYFIKTIPPISDESRALATIFSVIRSVSVPLGITTPGEPNIASTVWRTVHDAKDRTLYFDSATSPTVFWVKLSEIDFAEGSPVKKLTLSDGTTYNGDASTSFRRSEPFTFLPAKVD